MTAPATLLFFWDYDTQWGADRSRIPGGAKAWGHLEFEHTEQLLELHGRYEVPACFAVVGAASQDGERPYHDPDQVRRIHAAGHEVGSHSYHHDWLPGLGSRQLRETLVRSKDALEQCIGEPVVSFVPPYNQPCDYPGGWSISLAERQEAGPERTGLADLCDALKKAGYGFCRVMYRPLHLRLAEALRFKPDLVKIKPETISGLTCLRLNTACGFGASTVAALDQAAREGGWIVVYGHPHSLSAGNSQDQRLLVPFLERVQQYQRQGLIRVALPRELARN